MESWQYSKIVMGLEAEYTGRGRIFYDRFK